MKREITVKPTPQELAEEFWKMDSVLQAEFFAHLHKVSDGKMYQQMLYVVDEAAGEKELEVMTDIGQAAND